MNKVEFYPVLRKEVSYKLYVHICKEKNKYGNYGIYFGITCLLLNRRWSNNGNGYNKRNKNGDYTYFYKAILKHGWDNFEHIVLYEYLTKWEAEELEKFFIKYYNTNCDKYGYNSTEGGEGVVPNEKVKDKLRVINIGKKISLETRNKISKSTSKENNPMYGIRGNLNPNSKNVGYKHINSIKIRNKDTNIVYGSIREAERLTNICHQSIIKCCNNKQKTAGGYRWEYVLHNSKCKGRKIICLETLKIYNSIRSASREFNMSHTHLIKCCQSKNNKFNGLSWMYYDEYLKTIDN